MCRRHGALLVLLRLARRLLGHPLTLALLRRRHIGR
jgi:hypothetical protein